jgi:hypothetical protein
MGTRVAEPSARFGPQGRGNEPPHPITHPLEPLDMTLRPLAAAAALVLSATAALAQTAPRAVPISLSGDGSFSTTFKESHYTAGAFTDTFTFGSLSGGTASVGLLSWAMNELKDIDFVSASLNGHALSLDRAGAFDFASLASQSFTGPLVLTVSGIVGPDLAPGAYARGASYWVALGGEASVSSPTAPVPEPGTYALMLAGLSAIGFLARRRQRR